MVYIIVVRKTREDRVHEWLQVYQDKVLPWDLENLEKVGGKLVGCWYTEYGDPGEIMLMFAYPDLEAREKLRQAPKDVLVQEGSAELGDLAYGATITVLRPAAFSPVQ